MRLRLPVLVAVAGLVLLSGCDSGPSPASPSLARPSFPAGTTMARLEAAGQVTVGTKFDQPGFGLQGLDGKPEGFDVEIAKMIAAALGIAADKITWVETPASIREEMLERGKVDYIVATYTITAEREKLVSFAGPYYTAGQDIMVDKDDTKINGPESLKGNPTMKVCSVTGSVPAEKIKPYLATPSQLVLYDLYSKCVDALHAGTVQAITTDNVILLGLVAQSKGAFKLVGDAFTTEPYGVGVRKGDVAFCQFISGVLEKAASSGAFERAWDSTAGLIEGAQEPDLPPLQPCR